MSERIKYMCQECVDMTCRLEVEYEDEQSRPLYCALSHVYPNKEAHSVRWVRFG